MTIVEFLLARLAEEDDDHALGVAASWGEPGRVEFIRADIAAKRAVVEMAETERQRAAIYNRDYDAGELDRPEDLRFRLDANVRWGSLYDVLRAMAGVYRDHPDCDTTWEVWPRP